MCKGAAMDERKSAGGALCSLAPRAAMIACELCASRAALYCQADDAYLCRKCDRWVHGANFLAKRHVRCVLCNTCQKLTQRYCVGVSPVAVTARPSLVSASERGRCDDSAPAAAEGTESPPRTLKRPFLFL